MRFEIILIIITGLIMANIYTEGKYFKQALTWKKYYQMAGVAIGALMIYWLMKKNPLQAQKMLSASNDYVKYLPVDKNASSILSPILDFTTKQNILNDLNLLKKMNMNMKMKRNRLNYQKLTIQKCLKKLRY